MTTTLEAVKTIQEAKHDETTRITRRMEIGSVIQQGDVYLHRVAEDHPRGKLIGKGKVQIALGTGNGARHVVEGDIEVYEGVKLPPGMKPPMDVDANEVMGPVVVGVKSFALTHPEHPHHRLPACTFQTTYQFDPRTMRRVVD